FFGRAKAAEIPAEVQALVDRRAAARAAKDWAESDKIRDELAAAGWAVKDSKSGQQLSRI
ncbi:MAG: cysteine--tRNA ligase, partial [Kiritimatiellae bacterium]|nr:cysteine--tRNA ligase [Kiritimatiellia bacterium]